MSYEIMDTCTGCGMCLSICPVKAISGGPGRVHTIDSDYCIDCGACARVCASSSIMDPEGNLSVRESKSQWLVPHFDNDICRRCGKCYEMCPVGIIAKPSGDKTPRLTNPKLCASCRWCEKVCAFGGITFSRNIGE